MSNRIGDIKDLPPELIEQLLFVKKGSSQKNSLQKNIKNILGSDFGGIGNIDEILVGLYRHHKKVYKREFISNMLFRMVRAGDLTSIKGKKGVYTITKESVPDVDVMKEVGE